MDLRTREAFLSENFKQWARCVAVANVALLRIWTELLTPAHSTFETQLLPERYFAAIALTFLIGTGLWFAWRTNRLLWHASVLLLGLITCKAIFYAASNAGLFSRGALYQFLVQRMGQVTVGILSIAACWLAYRFLRDGGPPLRPLATALVPFALIVQVNGLWRALQPPAPEPVFRTEAVVPRANPERENRPRVVWLVLDELDERIGFTRRPVDLKLPHLDRFRREANFVAKQAQSPANATFVSIPSLLSGAERRELTAHPETLARMQRAGLRVGLTGWAIPYCSTIQDLTSCECAPMNWQASSYGSGFLRVLYSQARSLFETNVFSPFGQSLTTKSHVATIRRLEAAAKRMASRADLDVVFLHLPAPHAPFVFNRETGQPDRWSWPKTDGYLDNLVLADRLFGSIRAEMERTGVWDRTVVLVTADHGYRASQLLGVDREELHVPFMLKTMPGQKVNLDADQPFETVQTGNILARLLGLTTS